MTAVLSLDQQLATEREARIRLEAKVLHLEERLMPSEALLSLVPVLSELVRALSQQLSSCRRHDTATLGDNFVTGGGRGGGVATEEDQQLEAEAADLRCRALGDNDRALSATARADQRRLRRAGWRHLYRGRWVSPEGQVAKSRQEAIRMLAGRQLHLPVLVPVISSPRAQHPEPEQKMPPPTPEALTDVRQLAPAWNANLKGIRPPWDDRVNNDLQSKLERVARKDGRLRTLQEWRQILWRARASHFLMGKRPMSDGRLAVFTPKWLLNDGRNDGGPTFATRVETGLYDPAPTMRRIWENGQRQEQREHVDAHGVPWGPHRCQRGCSLAGCELEATTGYPDEEGLFLEQGTLCGAHAQAFEAWCNQGSMEHSTPAELEALLSRWVEAGQPQTLDGSSASSPRACAACCEPGDGGTFSGVRLNYSCGCAGLWRAELDAGRHFSEAIQWAAVQRGRSAA